jgi:hypothetical protein
MSESEAGKGMIVAAGFIAFLCVAVVVTIGATLAVMLAH